MSRIRKHIILLVVAGISAIVIVQFLRLIEPAQARAVRAACNGLQPSPTNPNFGNMAANIVATDFSLQDTEGRTVSLSEYQGKIVIVNFWASWCSVCRSEKPSLEKLHQDYKDDGVEILAVASDEDWAPVRRAMLGFEVASAEEILRKPEIYGVRDAKKLAATGQDVVVSRVDRGRVADHGGLRRLDRIQSVNGTPVTTMLELDAALRTSLSGALELSISRQGVIKTVSLSDKSPLHVLLDPPDDDGNLGAIAKGYGITAVPESFVVDRQGKIRHYFINKRNWDGDVAATCLQDLIDG